MQEIIQAITPVSTTRTAPKRTILLYQGEAPRAAYMLLKGVVKAYTLNQAGEEQISMFLEANDIFPTSWIFGQTRTTLYYYESLTDCQILTTPKEDFLQAIYAKPEYMRSVVEYFATNYTSLMMRITALEQSRAGEKLMFTLYYLAFRFGHEVEPGVFSVSLQLTHTLIASLVGLTRETTATELNKLKRMKVLDYKAGTYLVNKPALEHLLGEDSFKDLIIR